MLVINDGGMNMLMFSPLMYIQYEDEDHLNDEFRKNLCEPSLNANKVMDRFKDMYF